MSFNHVTMVIGCNIFNEIALMVLTAPKCLALVYTV